MTDTATTSRQRNAHRIALQFALVAAGEIESGLDEDFTARHDFMIEPDASDDGHPYVYITGDKAGIEKLSRKLNGSMNVSLSPRQSRDVEIILRPSIPGHKLS